MKIEVHPVTFEAHEADTKDLLFKVDMSDSAAARVSVNIDVNAREWQEISASILQCLLEMKLDGDQ